MEFILAIVVIVVLCIIRGVGTDVILIGALGLLGLFVLARAVFFIVFRVIFMP